MVSLKIIIISRLKSFPIVNPQIAEYLFQSINLINIKINNFKLLKPILSTNMQGKIGLKPIKSEKSIAQDLDQRKTTFLIAKSIKTKRKLSEKFLQITENLNKSFISKNQQQKKKLLFKSEIYSKNYQQTDCDSSNFRIEKQIPTKNQSIADLIQKSVNDPFIKRKLKALIENDLKSLKKFHDQGRNTQTACSSKTSFFNNPEETFTNNHHYALQTQFIHLSNNVGKILKNKMSAEQNPTIKRVNSQPYIKKFSSNKLLHQQTLPEKHEGQIKMPKNFTTLKQREYKKKMQNLEILRSSELEIQ